MATRSDLARIDARLRQFWKEYGMVVDFAIGAAVLAIIAFCIGYAFGIGAK